MLEDDRGALRRRFLPIVLCIVIGAGLGVWHNSAVARGSSDPFTTVARAVLAPLVSASGAVANWVGGTIGSLGQARRLARENASLRRTVATLTDEVHGLRESAITARRLQAQLGFLTANEPPRLPARVVALKPSAHVATLVIDRGTRSGVRSGSVVLAPDGIVGHVIDASPTASVVLLASDPRCAVGAMVQRAQSRAAGVCRGAGRSTLRLGYLSRDADVRTGDVIVTSGLGGAGGIYPKGLVIGSVTRVAEDLATSAKVATVRQAASPDTIEEVVVLR
ncbi:MAG: rod shape-determining protein MreC [Armatimonadetes bacterium]|nr:rod shape-determining protein MreC [Armatimonadota bacterium]